MFVKGCRIYHGWKTNLLFIFFILLFLFLYYHLIFPSHSLNLSLFYTLSQRPFSCGNLSENNVIDDDDNCFPNISLHFFTWDPR